MPYSFEPKQVRLSPKLKNSRSHAIIAVSWKWMMERNMAEEKVIEAEVVEPKKAKECDWLKKVDELSIGEIRKKYPKAFWIVGGVILISLIL